MGASLEEHLDQLLRRHAELRDALAGTGLAGADFAKSSKEYSELTPIVDGIENLRRARDELSSLADMAESSEDSRPAAACRGRVAGAARASARIWSSR